MHALAPTMPADLRALFASLRVETQGEHPRSERVFERLLDLKRCIDLGGVLDTPREPQSVPPDPPAPRVDAGERVALESAQLARLRLLESQLVARLRDLRAQVDRSFDNAFSGARAAPDAPALHALWAQRPGKPAAVAAHVAPRYVAVVDSVLLTIFKELTWLRSDVQQTLEQGDAELQRLAALDRVLDGIFRSELELCRAQLQTTLGGALEAQLHAACAALAEGTGVDALRPWLGPRGCIGHFLRDGRRLCHALLDLEWSALMGLLQAALQSVGPDPDADPDADATTASENEES